MVGTTKLAIKTQYYQNILCQKYKNLKENIRDPYNSSDHQNGKVAARTRGDRREDNDTSEKLQQRRRKSKDKTLPGKMNRRA